MNIALFCHSLLSDWNHGNAHFLRGVVTELTTRGHQVNVYEERDAWSMKNLMRDHGPGPIEDFFRLFPGIKITQYDRNKLDLEQALDTMDLVVAHEWNHPDLIASLGAIRARSSHFKLLFHDTHHRLATSPDEIRQFNLRYYDGVLAFGQALANLYRQHNLAERVWTWHEAADIRLFRPMPEKPKRWDLVWIGNWGDGERARELDEFLFSPASALGIKTVIHGVRYPEEALARMADLGVTFGGWLPNYHAPEAFSAARVTTHIPRRPYIKALPGIPTIRMFEAMACGIPLICAPWEDAESLFRPGKDYLVARTGREMMDSLRDVLNDASLAENLKTNALETIHARHTCGHRVDELFSIHSQLVSSSREVVA